MQTERRKRTERVLVALAALAIGAGCNGMVDEPDADPRPDTPEEVARGPRVDPESPGVLTDPDPNELDQGALFQCEPGTAPRTAPRIRRLTPDQLVTQWPTTLGRSTPYASDPSFRFSTDARDAIVDEDATAQLLELALEAGNDAVAGRRGWPRCLEADAPADLACLTEWAENALTRAYRRPPTADETAALAAYAEESIGRLGFEGGLALATARTYVRPDFLFHSELGEGDPDEHGRRRLGNWELANAIAFTLTDVSVHGNPGGLTEEMRSLRQAAIAGELVDAAAVEPHARALLEPDSTEVRPGLPSNVLRFFREYLGYPEAPTVFKSGGRPSDAGYGPNQFEEQMDFTIARVVRGDADVLATLLTTRTFWFDPDADPTRNVVYGRMWPFNIEESPDAVPLGWAEMPEGERAGVLTHPGWLAAHSSNQHIDPHPVHRGRWIRENMLCDAVPDIPLGVDAMLVEDPALGVRHRLDQTTRAQSYCWGCHQLMDPLGIPFESYNHYGRYRTDEILADDMSTAPVDASSTLEAIDDPVLDGATVRDAVEMMALFAESERVELCFLRQAFRYFMGRAETYQDACTLARMRDAYREGGGSFDDALVALMTSDSFLYRGAVSETEEGGAP